MIETLDKVRCLKKGRLSKRLKRKRREKKVKVKGMLSLSYLSKRNKLHGKLNLKPRRKIIRDHDSCVTCFSLNVWFI